MKKEAMTSPRKVGASIDPIAFGMAGVIYTEPSKGEVRDETWLLAGFKSLSSTVQHEWRSTDMTVVTYQHAHEAKSAPGSFKGVIPSVGEMQGVVFGQFFEMPGLDRQPEIVSRGVLSAYRSKGASCFRDINGMWAAVLWDSARRQAYFARDSIGGQTLYAAQLGGRIVFATDLRVFHASGMLRTLDKEALAQFLHYLYVPAPRTLVEGCFAVLPGSIASIGTSVRQEKYSAPRFVRGPKITSSSDSEHEMERQLPYFEEKLLTAVSDCIPEKGRIALTLSGGKDSSVLAVALSKICPDRVVALTVGQSDARLNEVQDAALVCRTLGLAHQCYMPTDRDLAQGALEFARVQDQPIGDPAALPYFLGMSQLPDDCTVIIDGTGNDYYFGIPSEEKGLWHYKRKAQIQKVLGPLWPLFLKALSCGPRGLRRLSHSWRRPLEESFVAWEGWSRAELTQLFGQDVSFAETYLWRLMRGADPEEWLALQTEVICGVWEPHAAYRKAIHFAHALGKSIRFPFTDNRLALFVQGLPEPLKFKNGINKQILRAYMKKNLPHEIVEKPKRGFIFDLNRLFENPVFRWPEELDRAGLLQVMPDWPRAPIQDLIKHHRQEPGNAHSQHRLYALCLLATVLAVKDGYKPLSIPRGKDV